MIKNVVDNSLRYGRQLDGDNIPLRQLFIIIEIALKHGLKKVTHAQGTDKWCNLLGRVVRSAERNCVGLGASLTDGGWNVS